MLNEVLFVFTEGHALEMTEHLDSCSNESFPFFSGGERGDPPRAPRRRRRGPRRLEGDALPLLPGGLQGNF